MPVRQHVNLPSLPTAELLFHPVIKGWVTLDDLGDIAAIKP